MGQKIQQPTPQNKPSNNDEQAAAANNSGGIQSGREGQLNGTPVAPSSEELSRQDNSQGTRSNRPSINESERRGSRV
ncbi:hypothetical protein [Undibacterium sp.]|uniref:hypothetical protein n=1 Tax=Undibacterium sp. TaxID=1914977 RepID=UPI00374CD4EF